MNYELSTLDGKEPNVLPLKIQLRRLPPPCPPPKGDTLRAWFYVKHGSSNSVILAKVNSNARHAAYPPLEGGRGEENGAAEC